jgi:hypothetical protein
MFKRLHTHTYQYPTPITTIKGMTTAAAVVPALEDSELAPFLDELPAWGKGVGEGLGLIMGLEEGMMEGEWEEPQTCRNSSTKVQSAGDSSDSHEANCSSLIPIATIFAFLLLLLLLLLSLI